MLAVENGDVADETGKLAFGFLSDFFGYFLFGFFELAEFHLDEFMIFQTRRYFFCEPLRLSINFSFDEKSITIIKPLLKDFTKHPYLD